MNTLLYDVICSFLCHWRLLVLTNILYIGYWEAYGLLTAERPVTSLSHAPGLLIMLAKAGHHKHLARILPKVCCDVAS